ncbi:hypothetical protein BJY52DRAFT_1349881 [Lactarius psammicola]|nr:hypothetical protein BJY52DRAFT_1349881 [Lactarius psammicola]
MPPRVAPPEGGRGERGRGFGHGGDLLANGPSLSVVGHGGPSPPLPAAHVGAIGVRRPGYRNAGTPIRLYVNHVTTELTQGMIYHYDGTSNAGPPSLSSVSLTSPPHPPSRFIILPEQERPIERNYQIIRALQTQVESRFSTRPGVFDGRRNLYTSFDLEFASGAQEARYMVPMGPASPRERGPERQDSVYTVRLTHVASINPEVLQRHLEDEPSHDNSVLTALTALNVAVRMAPTNN